MGALTKFQRDTGRSPKDSRHIEGTLPLGVAVNEETTLATVMMTRLYDQDVQVKFNRLMLMGQNDKVSSTFPLNRNVTTIGRSRRNHIRIKDPLVSVKHITVTVSGNICLVDDLESSNGTLVNGERLVGGRVLKDGDEIMIGKTILRFAPRQTTSVQATVQKPSQKTTVTGNKGLTLTAAALLFLMLSMTIVYLGTHIATAFYSEKQPSVSELAPKTSAPIPPDGDKADDNEMKAGVTTAQAPPPQVTPLHTALEDYAAGRLDSAEKTLTLLSAARAETPEAHRAMSLLSMINTVRKLHAKALAAQKEKLLAKSLEYWDRLLMVDMELVGDRPSFFASKAEQMVQVLSFEHALEAFRSKNHMKARQLCHVILQINPQHPDALALLAKIDPKA